MGQKRMFLRVDNFATVRGRKARNIKSFQILSRKKVQNQDVNARNPVLSGGLNTPKRRGNLGLFPIIYFASAAVAVDSSHMTASSSTSWSTFSSPSNFVNGHVSTTWFMVCRWPQSEEGDWARPHLCKLA